VLHTEVDHEQQNDNRSTGDTGTVRTVGAAKGMYTTQQLLLNNTCLGN